MRSSAASAVALIDTSAILALVDQSERWHDVCLRVFNNTRLPFITSEAVLTESFHLSRRKDRDARAIWRLIRSGALLMETIAHEELSRVQSLMVLYADCPMDFADATLVYLAARHRLSTVLTLDVNDFETYRLPGGKKFTIFPGSPRMLRL